MGMTITFVFVILLSVIMTVCGVMLLRHFNGVYWVARIHYDEHGGAMNKCHVTNANEDRWLFGLMGWSLICTAVCLCGGILSVV